MHDPTDARRPEIGAALARAGAWATRLGRRTRVWGWLACAAAPGVWAVALHRWVFGSWTVALAWLPLLFVLLIPGLVLLGFGTRMRRIADLPARVSGEVAAQVGEARRSAASEVERTKASGMTGLRYLVASLKDLRSYGSDAGEIVSDAAGTARVINPAYLALVIGAATAAGLLAILLIAALVLLFVI